MLYGGLGRSTSVDTEQSKELDINEEGPIQTPNHPLPSPTPDKSLQLLESKNSRLALHTYTRLSIVEVESPRWLSLRRSQSSEFRVQSEEEV